MKKLTNLHYFFAFRDKYEYFFIIERNKNERREAEIKWGKLKSFKPQLLYRWS